MSATPTGELLRRPSADSPVGTPGPGLRGYRTFVPPPEGFNELRGYLRGNQSSEACASGSRLVMQEELEQQKPQTPQRKKPGVALSPKAPQTPQAAPTTRERSDGVSARPSERRVSLQRSVTMASDSSLAAPSFDRRAVEVSPTSVQGEEELPEQPAQEVLELLAEQENPQHQGPLKNASHLEAATRADRRGLRDVDTGLQEMLKEDPFVLDDVEIGGQDAFGLYCASLSAFDVGPKLVRQAFMAVARDDVVTIEMLLDERRIAWDTKNAGGQTLLEMACARSRPRVRKQLEIARSKKVLPPVLSRSRAYTSTNLEGNGREAGKVQRGRSTTLQD